MRTLILCLLLFPGWANSLLAADPFVGTWTLNVGKSNPAPVPSGMAVKEETVVIEEISERFEVTVKGTQESGSVISIRYSHPANGAVAYSGLPAGISEVVKRLTTVRSSSSERSTEKWSQPTTSRHTLQQQSHV